jgi:hypothetical protein
MSKRNLNNEEIDRIVRELLGSAGQARREELENIVAAPHLFAAVRAKIAAEKARRERAAKAVTSGSLWNFSLSFSLPMAGAAVVIFLLIGALGAILSLTGQESFFEESAKRINTPAPRANEDSTLNKKSPPAENNFPPAPPAADAAQAEIKPKTAKSILTTTAKLVSLKTPAIQRRKVSAKRERTERAWPAVENKTGGEFYALSRPGGLSETPAEDLRVVRAELSRAALFALGVNLPIEDGAAKVKTDLLVGRDGVARAIRLVE